MSTSVAALTTNFFPSAENGFTTTTSGSVASGATTVGLNSTSGYTNNEVVTFIIDPDDSTKKQTFTGVIDTGGNQVTSVVWTAGTNQTHASGATVVDYASATHISQMTKGILIEHDQDGTHGAITASSITLSSQTTGVLANVRTYTADDTWSKPTGIRFVIVRARAGGGGGGGCGTTSGTGAAGGGGQGEFAIKKIAAGSLGSSETIDIGAGGAGGSASGNGAAGSNTTFGTTTVIATGGSGGVSSDGSNSTLLGGAGGSGGTGDLVIRGAGGHPSGDNTANYVGGNGGGEGGGLGRATAGAGVAGLRGGGGGGAVATGTTGQTGGAGGDGWMTIEEYF